MLTVREVPGKGRGVFATRDIGAGEVLLSEQPLVLYPQQGTAAAFCSHCLRAFNSLGEQGAQCRRLCTAPRAHLVHRHHCRQPAARRLLPAPCCLCSKCSVGPAHGLCLPLLLHSRADDSAAAVVPCGSCGRVGFCSSACAAAAAADPGSHCPAVCALLAACNSTGLTDEQQSALQFLFRCCSLRQAAVTGDAAAAARFAGIASLAAPPPLLSNQVAAAGSDAKSVRELHGRLSHALVAVGASAAARLTLEEAAELLRKDATNGYGIMAPSAPDVSPPPACCLLQHPTTAAAAACREPEPPLPLRLNRPLPCPPPSCLQGERRVRGTALYAHSSLINHECLPNVARFDRFDTPAGTPAGASSAAAVAAGGGTAPPPGANTAVEFRALHGIPAGEEVTQSYFPLPWPLGERQQRCQEDYAFQCACPRCQVRACVCVYVAT